jgi:hypothetical protein
LNDSKEKRRKQTQAAIVRIAGERIFTKTIPSTELIRDMRLKTRTDPRKIASLGFFPARTAAMMKVLSPSSVARIITRAAQSEDQKVL